MTAYEAVVYDLDGTVVSLDVDWATVATDVLEVYAEANIDPPGRDLWDLLEASASVGLAAKVEATIADHERAGARASRRLARADELERRPVPVGVCSLNCEAACEIALETHDIRSGVDAVVGRDTVRTRKPHPEPLLETVDRLGAIPSKTVFIGDSARDEQTAERAGTAFEWVD